MKIKLDENMPQALAELGIWGSGTLRGRHYITNGLIVGHFRALNSPMSQERVSYKFSTPERAGVGHAK